MSKTREKYSPTIFFAILIGLISPHFILSNFEPPYVRSGGQSDLPYWGHIEIMALRVWEKVKELYMWLPILTLIQIDA